MKQRALGTAQVTAIGCGDVSLEVAAARGVDARDVERTVHEALARGITLVDATAEDEAERLCGDAVRALRLRDHVVVATRVPEVAPRPGAPQRDVPQRDELPERLPAPYVQQRVEASLRATRLEVLPLVLLPLRAAWRDSPAWPEVAGTCARLVSEGKVQQWGAIADEPVPEPWLIAQLLTYNLCERAADALVEAAAPIVLARRPLAGGALAGNLGPGALLAPRDDRRALDDAQLERIAVAMARTAPLVERTPAAARSCDPARAALERLPRDRPPHVEAVTAAELALRFVIDRGAIALPRLHRRDHLDEALTAASAPPLSPELRERLAELYT